MIQLINIAVLWTALSAHAHGWRDNCSPWLTGGVPRAHGQLGEWQEIGRPAPQRHALRDHWIIDEIEIPESLSEKGGPKGRLRFLRYAERGVTKSNWYQDDEGSEWLVKMDRIHPGLQSSASVIAAAIYRHFGFITTDTFKIQFQGKTFSISRRMNTFDFQDFIFKIPDHVRRKLHIVEFLVADMDRSTPGNGYWDEANERLYLIDFDGTLGADPFGHIKREGRFVSYVVGKLPELPFSPLSSILFPTADADLLSQLTSLTDEVILDFVIAAEYSSEPESQAVVDFLRQRRDLLIDFVTDRSPIRE